MNEINIQKKIKDVRYIAYDFDGVMTDNRVLVDQDGKEAVFVNRGDGYAIARFKKMGIKQVIISTEKNPVVAARANKLGITVLYGVDDKGSAMCDFCNREGISADEVFYIGNDLNDMSAFRLAGIKGAPRDAEKEVLEIADWISAKDGGRGVIRDLYETYRCNCN